MCTIAAKYFKNVGWIGVKNRDRVYKPVVNIINSFRKNVERIYMKDEKTKYTEGINEFGVSIFSTTLIYDVDDEVAKERKKLKLKKDWVDNDGAAIRRALREQSPEKAAKILIESEAEGNMLIFNKETCYLLEGYYKDTSGLILKDYVSKLIKISKDDGTVVRTNHCIASKGPSLIGSDWEKIAMKSSKNRFKVTTKELKNINIWSNMFDGLSNIDNNNSQMNPMRITDSRGKRDNHTTGQVMLVPNTKSLHYKPIWGDIFFDFNKLNSKKSKTKFEVISSKDMIDDIEESTITSFKNWLKL